MRPAITFAVASFVLLASTVSAKNIKVGPGNDADFHTIQAAINAAQPGDQIDVHPGTYLEQLYIGAGKDNIKIHTRNAIVSPPISMVSGSLITVDGAQNLTIQGFTISGPLPDSAFTDGTAAAGIYVRGGGSATIKNDYITQIWQATATDRGIQNGIAILVGRQRDSTTGSAIIANNIIDHWQKTAIVIDNTGSSATITNNKVTGEGPIGYTAQNGIQVGRGAAGFVQNNSVSALSYTGPSYSASGILVFETGNVEVSGNMVISCDLGVAFADVANSGIDHNHISNGMYGIDVDEFSTGSQNNLVSHNDSNNNSQEGIFVSANSVNDRFNHNNFRHNAFLDAEDDSVGSGTGGTGNTWSHNNIGTDNHGGALRN